MAQFDEQAQTFLNEAIALQLSYCNKLKKLYENEKEADMKYQKFEDEAAFYRGKTIRSEGYNSLIDILRKDPLRYAQIVHESVGYALEQVERDGGF